MFSSEFVKTGSLQFWQYCHMVPYLFYFIYFFNTMSAQGYLHGKNRINNKRHTINKLQKSKIH